MSDRARERSDAVEADRPGERPVDWERDRRARSTYAVFLAGPAIWLSHFMLVYVVAEMGCTAEGEAFRAFAPPVPEIVTLVATAVAAVASVAAAWWGFARWRRPARFDDPADGRTGEVEAEPHPPIAFAGLLLSGLAFIGVLFVGLPAAYLPTC